MRQPIFHLILSLSALVSSCQERTSKEKSQGVDAHLTPTTVNLQGSDEGQLAIDVLTPCVHHGQVGCVTTDQYKACKASECSSLSDEPSVMQSFTHYRAIYVRQNGNDTQGDGNSSSPFATPQKAFDIAASSSGDIVIDIGEGLFGSIDLSGVPEWPRRIALRGAGSGVSKLGGINAKGKDALLANDKPTAGKNVTIISNNTVHLGNIDARGGAWCCGSHGVATMSGLVELTGVVAGNINVDASRGFLDGHPAPADGGTVTAVNSSIGDITANGVTDTGDGAVSNGGIITLTSSAAAKVIANGGSKLSTGCGAHGGRVYLKDSKIKGASLAGGSGQDANGELCDGQMGFVSGSR